MSKEYALFIIFLSLSFPFILHTCEMSNYVTLLKEIQSVFIFLTAAHFILLLCRIVYRNHCCIADLFFICAHIIISFPSEMEMLRRRSEKNIRTYSAREKMQEAEEQAKVCTNIA